jgi:hypothetical protein
MTSQQPAPLEQSLLPTAPATYHGRPTTPTHPFTQSLSSKPRPTQTNKQTNSNHGLLLCLLPRAHNHPSALPLGGVVGGDGRLVVMLMARAVPSRWRILRCRLQRGRVDQYLSHDSGIRRFPHRSPSSPSPAWLRGGSETRIGLIHGRTIVAGPYPRLLRGMGILRA